MNNDYAAGLAVGIIAAIVFFGIIWKFNKNKMKGKFDERQELVRGRGYKYACFTLLGLLTLDLLLESFRAFEALPITRELYLFFMILVGVMVYALYCIRNDSYFGVGMDTRTYRAVMWIVIVCNAISAVSGLMDGGAMVDGKLAFGPWAALIFLKMKSARVAKDLSQQQLADLIGVSRQTISAIEKGDYNPTINLCIAICRELGKTLDELFWED